ncbi:MAG: bifunctional proline dehydrogenase/L-glutamate gamma-semialdehyde dehydrogenase PutA [Pseudomonadota bacterium]
MTNRVPAATADVSRRYLQDESELVAELAALADVSASVSERVQRTATDLVRSVRRRSAQEGGLDAFMQQYDLSSKEGVLLMCIAEALLRIPDAATADRLIADKLTSARWEEHLGASDSLFVNASTWGLMLSGQMLSMDAADTLNPAKLLGKLASRAGEPVVRTAMRQAMRIIGHQFVMGRTIDEALRRSRDGDNKHYRYSFDMLGEAALTSDDAARYYDAYLEAIRRIGVTAAEGADIAAVPSISVKLSALHPRYEHFQRERVMAELVPRVVELAVAARDAGIAITIDAEESQRLEVSLDVICAAFRAPVLRDYEGFGLAVQAYQRRASDVVRHLVALAEDVGRRLPVRLVKGAYWDTEIKQAQELGLSSYPVFTRKAHTDVSYLACARLMLESSRAIVAQFATHNAHTIASIMQLAGDRPFEFQRLHGMGEELYEEIVDPDKFGKPCRVYAPVGSHEDLLPYLVRRLLENGANTSFVNRILDESVPLEDIVADPIAESAESDFAPHGKIASPADLFGNSRQNARGYNLFDRSELSGLTTGMANARGEWRATPLVDGKRRDGEEVSIRNPANSVDVVGRCVLADTESVDRALRSARAGQREWALKPVSERAAVLEAAADLFEENTAELLALCVREAGKTLPDAIAELREAVDFLRYYASQARELFSDPVTLPGPTGERNELGWRGKGVFVCISPWNFPLAIFTGQVAATLVAGNAVLAKPAEQSPLVAHRATELLVQAGVPTAVLHLLPGDGAAVGGYAVSQPEVDGVAFTGSTETAAAINLSLAKRTGPIATFVAETGGLNAMFVDSSALPEQVVLDAVASAFNSAGQRCSALRLLCVQQDIAPRVIELLSGCMQQLVVGDPGSLETDVGPVIDEAALTMLREHEASLQSHATLIGRCDADGSQGGHFFPPVAYEIDSIDRLTGEVFGPVLHVLRYPANGIATLMDAVNEKGFGLTMGLHSRIDGRAQEFARRSGAGNIYINRNMIGAVVGVQPFGGRGLSGTGPKAGGPHYLTRFASEYTVSTNTAAVGGNASLLSMDD